MNDREESQEKGIKDRDRVPGAVWCLSKPFPKPLGPSPISPNADSVGAQ